MKIKTSELTGKLLDWAVLKCEVSARGVHADYLMPRVFENMHDQHDFNYSTNWAQGGPIIERERINLQQYSSGQGGAFKFINGVPRCHMHGPTPLVAAMRCYVASKLGEGIDVPEEMK